MCKTGELLKKAEEMQPLFRTEELNEETFQQQDAFRQQFEEQQQFQTAQTQTTKDAQEELLANCFKMEEKEKIKEDSDDPQEPAPEFISLNYSGISITTADDKKMQAIKRAVQYYQDMKGDEEEAAALQAVIKACNSFTWGKFSLFSFGKSKVKLKEVKKLRADAEKALADLKQKEKERKTEKPKTDDSVFAPRIAEYIYDSNVDYPEELSKAAEEKMIRDRAKEIQQKYHFDAKRAQETARDEYDKNGMQLSNTNFKNRYLTEEEKILVEVEEEVEKRLNDMSSVKRFFTRIFAKDVVKSDVMKDTLKRLRFQYGVNTDNNGPSLSKNDSDFESTFL